MPGAGSRPLRHPIQGRIRVDREGHRADGVGFFPQERLSPLPVFKVGKGVSGTPLAHTPENNAETLPKPFLTVRKASGPIARIEPNRATTSHIETTHRTRQRQVATGLSPYDSKWPSLGIAPPPPALSEPPWVAAPLAGGLES